MKKQKKINQIRSRPPRRSYWLSKRPEKYPQHSRQKNHQLKSYLRKLSLLRRQKTKNYSPKNNRRPRSRNKLSNRRLKKIMDLYLLSLLMEVGIKIKITIGL